MAIATNMITAIAVSIARIASLSINVASLRNVFELHARTIDCLFKVSDTLLYFCQV